MAKVAKPVEYKNIVYPSLKDACLVTGINYNTAIRRILLGEPIDTALDNSNRHVKYKATTVMYGQEILKSDIKRAAKNGIDRITFSYRIKRGWSITKAVNHPCQRNVIYKNTKYSSITEVCKQENVGRHLVFKLIKQGNNLEQAIYKAKNCHPLVTSGWVYIVHNNVNNLKYIGVTIVDIQKRMYSHKINALTNYKTKNNKFSIALRTLGVDNFWIEKLCICFSKEELQEKEKYYIKKYNSINEGYNTHDGGAVSGKRGTVVKYKNQIFGSYSALAKHLNVDRNCIFGSVKYHKKSVYKGEIIEVVKPKFMFRLNKQKEVYYV